MKLAGPDESVRVKYSSIPSPVSKLALGPPFLEFLDRILNVIEKLCSAGIDGLRCAAAEGIVNERGRRTAADACQMIARVPGIGVRPIVGQIAIRVIGHRATIEAGHLVVEIERVAGHGARQIRRRHASTLLGDAAIGIVGVLEVANLCVRLSGPSNRS